MRTVHAGVAALVILALAGCAPGAPSDDPTVADKPTPTKTTTAKPTPTPTPAVHVSSIVVDGDSISVNISEGGVLVDIPFTTDPATASAQLGEAIGLPAVVTSVAGTSCSADTTIYGFGGIDLRSPGGFSASPGAQFVSITLGATTTNGIAVTIPSGHGVGAAEADVLAANASAPTSDFGGGIFLLDYDVKSGSPGTDPDNFFGALAIFRDGALHQISSPIRYEYDC
ncbi:MAG: hypothetical protein ABJB03_01400 [Rhodoglobus sp.]